MIKLRAIGQHLGTSKQDNIALAAKFELDPEFIAHKIGVSERAHMQDTDSVLSLCTAAFKHLAIDIPPESIDCCILVTQNPDRNIPHGAAELQHALNLPTHCACFDLSLGCSGYVYGLSVITGFMQTMGFNNGLLFTCDPYSRVVSKDDKNTALIFGDGATVSWLSTSGSGWVAEGFDFGTDGSGADELCTQDGQLYMNGRAVFNFTASRVPRSIQALMTQYNCSDADISRYYLHQGSRYIVDTITQRAKLDADKVVFGMQHYGNTVSSSIPMLMGPELGQFHANDRCIMSGFGVGLSWASGLFKWETT
ncbi:MAG: ketoacyl-ACP synthase III [Gammaproteobacteria bacterium]|nr:ketoacyl-ACP synthase III [Gammaproteobacteria bacterium]